MPTRREVLATAVTAAGASTLGAALYTWLIEPHWLEITERDLPIIGLPHTLDGATLAQLSDLHVGPKVSNRYLSETFRRVAARAPDFVVCTGDWITYRKPAQISQLADVLRDLPRGRLGTVGILGNHDYGLGWRMPEVAERVAAIARHAGVQMLRNESATIGGLQFLGLDDLWGPHFDPADLLALHAGDPGTIVLCHNPDAADRPVWSDFGGWILAGHTHGGQCKPPFLPPPLLPVQNKRYIAGEIGLEGSRRMYISRGVGHLLKVRFNVRPEVALFRLRRTTLGDLDDLAG